MKNNSILFGLILICAMFFFGFVQKNSSPPAGRTEEYAMIDVLEIGKNKVMRITVGETPVEQKVWEREKTEDRGDFTPVMQELNKLNEQGFELVNVSVTYTTANGGTYASIGSPRHTFMMRKKL